MNAHDHTPRSAGRHGRRLMLSTLCALALAGCGVPADDNAATDQTLPPPATTTAPTEATAGASTTAGDGHDLEPSVVSFTAPPAETLPGEQPPVEELPPPDAIALLEGRTVDLRGSGDPNDLTATPRRLGLSPTTELYSWTPINDGSTAAWPAAFVVTMSEGPVGPRAEAHPHSLLLVSIEAESPDPMAAATVVDVLTVNLGAGEQLSTVHIGCSSDSKSPGNATIVGVVQTAPGSPRVQVPRSAWSASVDGFERIDPAPVACELAGWGEDEHNDQRP